MSLPRLTIEDFPPETVRGAPGFFRVGQARGQWWLIDPHDRPFFSRGVTAVNRSGRIGGRWAAPGPYTTAVEAKYGPDPAAFVRATVQRLRAWHFNTLGAWATPEFFDQGMAYTEIIDFSRTGPQIRAHGARLPDVYDPAWSAALDAWAKERCAPRRESRELIGYFTDHELGWAQPGAEGLYAQLKPEEGQVRPERPSLLQICLSLEPSFAAYHAAWEFALALHGGGLERLAATWGIELPNKETLRAWTNDEKPLLGEGYLRDCGLWSREFARRYFAAVAMAVRRHDPNHLVLGCRFGGPPGAAVLVECVFPAVDVLSAGSYRDTLADRIDLYHRATGMPVLVGEFAWVSEYFTRQRMDREPAGLTSVERMLRKGRAALERAFTHPALVGYAWNRWVDHPESESLFGSGLVHIDDRESVEHTELLTFLNGRAERLRRAAARR